MTQEIDTLNCGTQSLYTDLMYGVNSPGGVQFSGMKGYAYLLDMVQTEMATTRSTNYALSIRTQNAKAQGTVYTTSLTDYHNNWNAATVKSPLDGTTNISPDVSTNMITTITAAIGTENIQVNAIATNQTDGAEIIHGLSITFP